jgi:hypothetical protein
MTFAKTRAYWDLALEFHVVKLPSDTRSCLLDMPTPLDDAAPHPVTA